MGVMGPLARSDRKHRTTKPLLNHKHTTPHAPKPAQPTTRAGVLPATRVTSCRFGTRAPKTASHPNLQREPKDDTQRTNGWGITNRVCRPQRRQPRHDLARLKAASATRPPRIRINNKTHLVRTCRSGHARRKTLEHSTGRFVTRHLN